LETEEELGALNPFARPPKTNNFSKPPPTRSYLRTVASAVVDSNGMESDAESVEEVHENYKFSNSTGTFVLPNWMFGFKYNSVKSYLCITVNIPSGVADDKYGLEGKLEAKVTPCCTKLAVACEWPSTLVDSTSLQDALSTEFRGTGGTRFGGLHGRVGTSSTVSNILLAFETEMQKIPTKNKVSHSYMLGSTCTINLPYLVERKMVLCTPNLDPSVESVNLYIVLHK
jgi:hypothetical protein